MDDLEQKPDILDRFEDPDTEVLEELLDQLWEDGAMDLEELDGFFAALHCCPVLVPATEFLPEILGDASDNKELFPTPETAELFFGLIMHHWNSVAEAFHSETFFEPLLLEDEDGKFFGNNWTYGFMRGMDMRKESWGDLFHDEDKFAWLIPILALAHEDDPDLEMRSYQEPVSDELREKLIAGVSAMVTHLYHYFAPHRKLNASVAAEQHNPLHPKRKIGRNDPCYCGSGEKYKKCCGAVKVN